MATLAKSDVTIVRSWSEGGINGKDLICRLVRIASGSYDTCPAAAFDLSSIEQCSNFVNTNDTAAFPVVPSYDGSKLLFMVLPNPVFDEGDPLVPIDNSGGEIQGVVKGYA
jgi:hypothetical protein